MNDCIFCKIIAGEIPSKKVYEDELVYAFEDINPQMPIHILFVPKQHIDSAGVITAENSRFVSAIFEAIAKVAAEKKLDEGFRVVTNCGKHGCQSVKHLHFHLLGGSQMNERMN